MHAPKLALFFDVRFVTGYVAVALIFEGYRRYDAVMLRKNEMSQKKTERALAGDLLAASEQ